MLSAMRSSLGIVLLLAIALPAVAVGVALAGVLAPWAIALYPLLTIGMTAEASRRLDQVEVTT